MVREREDQEGMMDQDELRAYYEGAAFEFNFASMCKMTLPAELAGLRVLDIGCRRGKGVFKLSARVGPAGHVVGVDWTPGFIAEAQQRCERAWRESGLPANNMEFHVAYPEDLRCAGLGEASVDLVFVNSVVNLAADPPRAFAEMARVLAPDGLLVCETVVARRPRDPEVVRRARELGNNVQAAPSVREFEDMLARAGFAHVRYVQSSPVDPAANYVNEAAWPTVDSPDQNEFAAVVAYARRHAESAAA